MNQLAAHRDFEIGLAHPDNDGPQATELYDLAESLVPMGAWSCDLASERLTWTNGVFDIFGLSADRAPERRETVELFDEESRELLERKRSKAIETCSGFTLDAGIIRPDGARRWLRITAATRGANGRADTLYGMKQDITEDRARWEALRAQAECDPLTGVANRVRFQRFLERTEDEAPGTPMGTLILFDMDNFKRLNDQWGHAAGDACLVAFGARLRQAFPQARLVSRIGGDEFAVLLQQSRTPSEMEDAVRSLMGNLLRPVPWQGDFLPLNVSVGLAVTTAEDEFDPQQLYIAADEALYNAKATGSTVIAQARTIGRPATLRVLRR
ncbi:diguanylate cyclase [Erythrobacter sp. QSSC1-22B]|uniref:sensor domain-containing diguanylate cyclase n=1 Tax=Erythrobacter sp. QSSC1-22B TaxID=1860125 RepID=UPI0008051805|nr:diguanylate cyclase [Erythrobacter sp. QSSC1-22B]OBX19381.1 diguanylate cyclase [Erythrobacter sp. QSSC1-22B]